MESGPFFLYTPFMRRERPITPKEIDILLKQIELAWQDGGLNGRDEEFLLDMRENLRPGFQMTDKQRYWLNSIFERTGVHRDPRDPFA